MNDRAITVMQLSTYIKQIFDAEEMLFDISVIGEVSGLSIVRGVAYFILKDENAMLSCVSFNATNFDFKNGDKVVVTGSPKYYVKGGKLNFNVYKIEKTGVGDLYQKFIELKQELEKNGYFDESIKKPIPSNIKRIGVVTSREGAVIQDIINVRTRRNPYIDIVLYPVKVQGINAENEIAKGISFFDKYDKVDLIIVARGGGSLEDLQPFNTKVVADAIFKCNKFVLSAVGHETDFTICDFCSDLRAPTPSAAAELVCDNILDKVTRLKSLNLRLKNSIKETFIEKQTELVSYVKDIKTNYEGMNIALFAKLKNSSLKISSAIQKLLLNKESKLNLLNSKLIKLNPEEILKLGYASIKLKDKMIYSYKDVKVGDELNVKLKDGSFDTIVKNINKEK